MNADDTQAVRPVPTSIAVRLLASQLANVLVWFVPIVFLVPVTLYAIASRGGPVEEIDVMSGITVLAPTWFLFAMGATLLTQHLPVAVAHGMTRGRLATALTWTLTAAAALLTLAVPLGAAIEGWAYAAFGWEREVDAGGAVLLGVDPLRLAHAFLQFAAMAGIGVLAAIVYYRGPAQWRGLLAFAAVAAPGAAVLYALGDDGAWIAPAFRTLVGLATFVIATAAYHLLLRGTTIRNKPA